MDSTLIRIAAQVALVMWCGALGIVLGATRARVMRAAGHRWAWLGLGCFAVWMFASALTTRNFELFPRSSLLWLFAFVELGTAAGAWGWLATYVRSNFQVHIRKSNLEAG